MESPLPAVLPIPRLRMSRHVPSYDVNAVAGPSRDRLFDPGPSVDFNQNLDDNDPDDDQISTPKLTSTATLLATAETPAERLRALLSRVPTSTKTTPMPHRPSHTPSEIESDFDLPDDPHFATPSMARESLKDIFSRALRDPGNTPQKEKSRPRRNSIDVSEVEASPRVQRERAKNKGKRRSMSDEELEHPSSAFT